MFEQENNFYPQGDSSTHEIAGKQYELSSRTTFFERPIPSVVEIQRTFQLEGNGVWMQSAYMCYLDLQRLELLMNFEDVSFLSEDGPSIIPYSDAISTFFAETRTGDLLELLYQLGENSKEIGEAKIFQIIPTYKIIRRGYNEVVVSIRHYPLPPHANFTLIVSFYSEQIVVKPESSARFSDLSFQQRLSGIVTLINYIHFNQRQVKGLPPSN